MRRTPLTGLSPKPGASPEKGPPASQAVWVVAGTWNYCSDTEAPPFSSARHVPVRALHSITGFGQALADLLRDHHRAMLAAGASKAYREVALSFLNVVGQQEEQQLGRLVKELLGLRKLAHILCHLRVLAGQRPELRDEVRIRQKTHIEDQVRLERDTVLVTEADERNHQVLAVARVATLELAQNEGPQLVHIVLRCIHRLISHIANGIEQPPLGIDRLDHGLRPT